MIIYFFIELMKRSCIEEKGVLFSCPTGCVYSVACMKEVFILCQEIKRDSLSSCLQGFFMICVLHLFAFLGCLRQNVEVSTKSARFPQSGC